VPHSLQRDPDSCQVVGELNSDPGSLKFDPDGFFVAELNADEGATAGLSAGAGVWLAAGGLAVVCAGAAAGISSSASASRILSQRNIVASIPVVG
jgi:hypothetical protein